MTTYPTFLLTEKLIRRYSGEKTFIKSEEYLSSISDLILRGNELTAKIQGNASIPYSVKITLTEQEWQQGECNCPSVTYPCKHLVATLLKIVRQGIEAVKPTADEVVSSLDNEVLKKTLLKIIRQNPDLIDDLQLELIKPKEKNYNLTLETSLNLLQKKITHFLASRTASWQGELDKTLYPFREFFAYIDPFLKNEEGHDALKVLKVITEPLLIKLSKSYGYTSNVYYELLAELELFWVEAFLLAKLSKKEKHEWRDLLVTWQKMYPFLHFETIHTILEKKWNHPLLRAAIKNRTSLKQEIADKKATYTISQAAYLIFKRREQYDKCLALLKLAKRDEEYASLLIHQQQFEESYDFIKNEIKKPAAVLRLAYELYENKQTYLALELIKQVAPQLDDYEKSLKRLIGWARGFAFDSHQLDLGIEIGTKILQNSPTLEDYKLLQKKSAGEWAFIQSRMIRMVLQAPSYYLENVIEIVCYEGKIDLAIDLVEQNKLKILPLFLLDEALKKRPEWVLKTCEELAVVSISKNNKLDYKEAIYFLTKALAAAQELGQVKEWQEKMQQFMETYKRKRNFIPLLEQLLSAHKQ